MNRMLIWLAILLLIVCGAWYWRGTKQNIPPTITITTPLGGEIWRPGEEHTISWETRSVPASDRISLTISRIPPPPLREEGQEFDPIIFTDIPNTGSTTWKISPMYPDGTYVIGIHSYASVPVTNGFTAESAPFTLTHPKISANLLPLYDGVDWNATEVESFTIGTTTYSGASVISYPILNTMNPSSIFSPFEKYYDKKLKALGWSVANDLAAGGHVGGQIGYQRDGETILTRFHVDYHTVSENAPSECPCDVTVSLFSTEQ